MATITTTATKRKATAEATPSDFSNKTETTFFGGLTSWFDRSSWEPLIFQQQKKKRDWVGAYPTPQSQRRIYYFGGVAQKDDGDSGESTTYPGRFGRRYSPASDSSSAPGTPELNKPYQLEPYTKTSSLLVPGIRGGRYQQSSPSLSSSSIPGSPGSSIDHFQEQEAAESEPTSSSPSSSSSLSPLPSDSKQTMDGTTRHQQLKSHRLFGNQYKSRIIDQSTLLKARPRIYASKSQNTASLLQSKYNKDESIARQRLLERRTQYFAKSDSGRLKAALDATFGAFRPDQKTFTKEDSTASTAEDLIAEHRRIRAINRSFDKVDWESEQTVSDRRPAWLRTKYQGPQEPSWLRNLRNLVSRNLPSVEQQVRPPAHQKLVDEHERIEKELAERKRPTEDTFKPFVKEDEQRLAQALSDGHGQVAEGFNVVLMKKDIHTLRPGEWLNDEVINFFGHLIMARSKESATLPKVHVFSTFFYKTLSENGYDKVRRWTKKVNIFALDYVLIPIHCSGNHWTSAIIDNKNKRISYFDSLLGNNPKCFLILRNYLEKESLDKRKEPFDIQGWENECPKDIPRQQNGYDCGVFTCFFIENKSRGLDQFEFTQKNMPYLRKKLALSIINKAL